MSAAVRRFCSGAELKPLSLHYDEPAGHLGLRQALASRLSALGIAATPQQLITTVGATHALDIVSCSFLCAGDFVMVEVPGLMPWACGCCRCRVGRTGQMVDGCD